MTKSKQHLFLIGMMGSGKSTVGKLLARELAYDYIDLDDAIVQKAGKSIEDIFREDGQDAFRMWEKITAEELELNKATVIATGGGFPLREDNRKWMASLGTSIWLQASAAHILDRIKDEDRPLLPKPIRVEHIEKILDERTVIYAKADMAVDTQNKSPEEIVSEIMRYIQ